MKLPFWYFRPSTGEIVLMQDYAVEVCGRFVLVPKGFASDGMSVPRLLWGVISPQYDPRTLAPSVVHDWLYTVHIVSRREADEWFKSALLANGFGTVRTWLVFCAVRVFGETHWS